MKKRFSKLMAWVLTLAMIAGLLPVSAFAGDETVAFGEIIAFAPLDTDVAAQTVPFASGQWDINLPAELTATVRFTPPPEPVTPEDGTETATPAALVAPLEMELPVPVVWDCADFDGGTPGTYTFTAAVGGGFIPLAAPPVITVTVEEDPANAPAQAPAAPVIITAFDPEPYSSPDDPDTHYAVVDKGTAAADIPLPSSLAATVDGGADYTVAVAEWVCEQKYDSATWQLVTGGYDPDTAGIYVFVPVLALKENEILADGVTPPSVEVVVTENMAITPLANSYTWDVSTTNTRTAADGDEITLSGTLTNGVWLTVPANATVTIYGTITGANTDGLNLQIGANAKVIWNASLTVEGVAVYIRPNSEGEFIMESGIISSANDTGIFCNPFNYNTAITITGGTVTSGAAGSGYAAIQQSTHDGNGTITVKTGGKVEATNGGYAIYTRGHVIIDGGTVRSKNNDAIFTAYHDVTVNSGTVEVTGTGNAIFIAVDNSNKAGGNVTVESGTVSSDAGDAIRIMNGSTGYDYYPKLTINGGTVEATGTGNAIYVQQVVPVKVNGGKVLAKTGHAIYDLYSSAITVEDGLVFAYGSAVVGTPLIGIDNVVYKANGTFTANTNVPPIGMVIAWDKAKGNTVYTDSSTTDIRVLPTGVTAYWSKDGSGNPGIYYARGANTGFIPLPVTIDTAVDLGNQTVLITAPVSGVAPQSTVADGTGYVGTGISWNGSPAAFEPSTVYTATVTLTSTNGYKWPVTPPTITVSGGTVGNRVVSGGDAAGNVLTFTVTFPATADAPGAPTGLTATPGDKKVTLAWTAPASVGGSAISGYEYTYTYTYGGVTTIPWTPTGSTGTTFTITNLYNGIAYNFQVRAVNAAGISVASNTAAATPRMVPYAPTNLSATAGDGQVTLSWTEPTNGGSPITDYEYTADAGSTWISTGGTGTTFTATGLTNYITYSFLVRAVNAAGAGPASSQASAMSVDTTVPILSSGSVTRTSHIAATIGFTTDKAGEAYYLVLDRNASAPTEAEVVSDGASLGPVSAGAVTDLPVTLTAGDKDIYVVVVNSVGVSYHLCIEADAFNSLSQAIVFNTTQTTAIYGDSFTHTAVLDGAGGTGAVTYAVTNGAATVDSDTGEVTVTGVGNVTITATKAADATYDQASASYSFTADPKTLTITGVTATDREYDGTTSVTLTGGTLSGAVVGDDVNNSTISGTIADANVGNNKAVTIGTITLTGADAGNYTLTQPNVTVNIAAKALTITGVTATDREYDGTTSVALTGGTLSGVEIGDAVSFTLGNGTITNKSVGTGKAVNTNITLTGADAGNYTLTQPSGVTVNITAKALTISGVAATNREYDGTTSVALAGGTLSGEISGDAVNFTLGSGTMMDKSVGTGKAVTANITLTGADAGNYTLTQPTGITVDITAKTLTVTGLTGASRPYDGTTSVTFTGGTLSGVESGDDVSPDFPTTGTIADADAGNNKAVTIGAVTLTGADAGNYTLTQPTGITVNITPVTLTPSISFAGVTGKTYDGTTAITGTQPTITLSGAVNSETPAATAAFAFADANVGTNKNVIASNIALSGTWGTNYTLSVTALTAVSGVEITKAAPSVTWPTGLTAIYGQMLANVSISGGSSTPMGSFTWTTTTDSVGSVGSNAHDMTFTPTDAINYNSATQAVSINVSAAPITGTVTIDQTMAGTVLAANDTLTANVSGVSQAGTADPLTYEWFRGGISAGAASTTNNTYTITAADQTAQAVITVKVSGTNNHTGTLESAPVIVGKATLGGSISISGGTTVGSVLSLVKTSLTPSGATHTTKWLRDGTAISGQTGDSYTIAAADLGKTITVEVTGNGSFTGSLSVSVNIPAVASAVPQNFTSTAGDAQVTLVWSAPASDGGAVITGYQVSSDNGTTWTAASSNTGHIFTGLANGTSYTFKVRAVNSIGNGAEASATATPTAAATVPTAPQNFAATAGNGQVTLVWIAPVSDGGAAITGYQVSSDNGTSWVAASSNTGHTFTGLANGTSYTFKVRAVNSAGSGAEASKTATPLGGGGSTGGGTGGGGGTATTPTPANPTVPVNDDTVKVVYTKKDGAVTLNLTDAKIREIISKETDKTASFDLTGIKEAETAVLDVNAAQAFNGAGIAVTLQLPNAAITLSPDALAHLAAATDDGKTPITVEAAIVPMKDLKGLQAAQVKGYETVVSVDIFVGANKVDVPVTISLPYTLKADEQPAAVCVWHLDGDGNLTKLNGVYEEKTGMITFTVNHQSYFVVGYDPVALWINVFSDIAGDAWYYDAAAYSNYYGLFNGDGSGHFMPEQTMTRAMFVAVLWNLEGKPNSQLNIQNSKFTDVPSGTWYYGAVQWAAESGIVSGAGGGKYAPDRAITRQEMAVMLMNYAKLKGYDIPENRSIPVFKDQHEIDLWAESAAKALSEAGVISGDEDEFMPHKEATRAEVAQLFKNFIRFVAGK